MAGFASRRLPKECMECGKAEGGNCPYRMGERQNRYTVSRLRRGVRKVLPIDGSLPAGRSIAPDVAVLVPTLRCSMHCPYCFQRGQGDQDEQQGEGDSLSLNEWQAIIGELEQARPRVVVMGGELFLYPEALALLRAIKAADLNLTVITNGVALPRVAEHLLAMGLNQLVVSIDGPAHVHNTLRGHARGFELATAGIQLVVNGRGICPSPFVQVSCTVSAYTQGYLEEFVEVMGHLNVDRILFNSLIYATAEQVTAHSQHLRRRFQARWSNMALDHHARIGIDPELLGREMAAIRAGPWSDIVYMTPPGVEQNLAPYYAPHAPPFENQRCTAVYRELWILPNGDLAACAHIPELSMGNVRAGGVMDAWNSPRYREFRQHLAQGLLPACVRCEKLQYVHPPDPCSL